MHFCTLKVYTKIQFQNVVKHAVTVVSIPGKEKVRWQYDQKRDAYLIKN